MAVRNKKQAPTGDMVLFVASSTGFINGGRVRPGETFMAEASRKFSWAHPANEADVLADAGGPPGVLDMKMVDIPAAIVGLQTKEVQGLLEAEQAGRARKGVMAALSDELSNRVGRVGGPDPQAKQPEEKAPKTAGDDKGGKADEDGDGADLTA